MRSGNSLSSRGSKKVKIVPPLSSSLEKERGDCRVKIARTGASRKRKDTGSRKTVILGIGNLLLCDEGVGVHVANELLNMDLPPYVSVVEGGTDGFRLLNIITDADRLIIVDTVRGGASPGSIYRFDIDEVRSCPSGFRTSVHQVGILEVIDLSGLIGKTPHTTVIGVEPKSLEMSMELSPEIREKIPRVIELVLEELKRPLDN
jgi:hydrogenase maturation protease